MFLRSFHLVFCIGLFILKTGALVHLTTKGNNGFVCGDSEFLICTIDPPSATMAWTKDTSVAQLASCSPPPASCSANPSFVSEYTFTFNRSSGIFEMTILNVTLTDQGTMYFCDDGVDSDNITADVIVNEMFNTNVSDQRIDSITTEVTATTGCIKNTTMQNVKFIWWLQEENSTTGEKHYLDESDSYEVNDDSVCKADTDCRTNGFTRLISYLNLTEVETGKLYNVGIDVTFGSDYNDSVRLETSTFMLNYMKTSIQTTSTTTEWPPSQEHFFTKHKIPVAVVSGIVLLIILVLVCICVQRSRNCKCPCLFGARKRKEQKQHRDKNKEKKKQQHKF